MQPIRKRLDDDRWHFHYGPIDLVISVDGELDATDRALTACWQRFTEILPELVAELSLLRQPLKQLTWLSSPVARRMVRACYPYRAQFITPMAAVAGSVADELIGFFAAEPEIRRAGINNGGDIALHLQAGQYYTVGMVSDIASLDAEPQSHFEVDASIPVRGVATSGWRGRSMSLGIADSVTVLAQSAAMADAAATMIANAVNVQHEAIQRAPASALKDDTDLGDLLVTTHVGPLPAELIQQALDDGAKYAQYLLGEGLIFAAALTLQGQSRLLGEPLDRLALQVRRAA
ncbi:MAG: hypothetical protein RLZZ375_2006 [Pseudomonadota bacterium]|jgi:ApbE superfamily uncharacterized protein (UPF0280 family)